MNTLKHIEAALKEIDDEVNAILLDTTMSLTDKDDKMLPLVQQKRVLQQTLEDLIYLRDNPPSKQGGCGMSRYRED